MSSRKPDGTSLPAELTAAWRADHATDAEVRAAYLRYLRRQPLRSRTPWLEVARWLLAGMALGGGAVYAATGEPRQLLERLVAPPAERASMSASPREQRPPARAASSARALAAPLASVTPATPSARSGFPISPLADAPDKTQGARIPQGIPRASKAPTEGWQRVARSLREDDLDAAHAALLALDAQGNQAERESAKLVRAQLLLSQGRTSEALPLLLQLRASAQSASVRRKATELFEQVP